MWPPAHASSIAHYETSASNQTVRSPGAPDRSPACCRCWLPKKMSRRQKAGGRLGEGSAALESGGLEGLVKDRFATRSMAVIPAECPRAAEGALPGKDPE